MFLFDLAGETGGFDPLILLLLALCLEGLVGNFVFPARPGAAVLIPFARLMDGADHKLNRESRSHAVRTLRGALVVLFFLVLALALGLGVAWASQNLPFAWILELALLITLIAQRGLVHGLRGAGLALDTDGARIALERLGGEGLEQADIHGLARQAVEISAGGFSERVMAPVFYYALFGLPGLLIYRVLSMLAIKIGRPGKKYRGFGFTAARMAGVLDLIPARLAGIIIVLAAMFVPSARPGQAWKAMGANSCGGDDSSGAYLGGQGWPLGAMGGALDLSLTGRHGPRDTSSWMGGGRAKAVPRDVSRALYVFGVACLLNAAWVGALTVFRYA